MKKWTQSVQINIREFSVNATSYETTLINSYLLFSFFLWHHYCNKVYMLVVTMYFTHGLVPNENNSSEIYNYFRVHNYFSTCSYVLTNCSWFCGFVSALWMPLESATSVCFTFIPVLISICRSVHYLRFFLSFRTQWNLHTSVTRVIKDDGFVPYLNLIVWMVCSRNF